MVRPGTVRSANVDVLKSYNAILHTILIQTHVSVSVSPTNVHPISILTKKHAVVVVTSIQPALVINTSMIHHVDAIAVMSRNVAQGNTTTMMHVNVTVATLQHVMHHTTLIHNHASVSAGLMTATQVSTLTQKAVAVSVVDT